MSDKCDRYDMSINKIHINNTTKISLNDRFTVIQSTGPKAPPPRRIARRQTPNLHIGSVPKASIASRKFLDQLEKKHKMLAALKLKRRSLKANLPTRKRIQNRLKKAIRLAPNGKLFRTNSLSRIPTLKSDFTKPAPRRSNSTSNLAARLGTRRVDGASQAPRRKLKRNNLIRSNSKQNLSRSISVSNLRRSNSKVSLRGSNSRLNLNPRMDSNPRVSLRNIRSAQSSARRGRGRGKNINSRRGQPLRGVAQGKINKRRNSIEQTAAYKTGIRQGRSSRSRGRGNAISQRGRSLSRSNVSRGQNYRRGGTTNGRPISRGNRGNARGANSRGRNIRRRGISRPQVQRLDLKKEDLDKELDQYMANTKSELE